MTACGALNVTEVVFLGRVTVDSGEGWGTLPGRFVEEILQGLPAELKEKEVEVDTSVRTSCYWRLELGERYVVFASRQSGRADRLRSSGCSFSFGVRGNEALLNALRQAKAGGPASLVGKVYRMSGKYERDSEGVIGATVYAEGNGERIEASTFSGGQFEFRNLVPGTYRLSVSSPGFVQDESQTWPSKGPVRISARSCESRSLSFGRMDALVEPYERILAIRYLGSQYKPLRSTRRETLSQRPARNED